MITEWLMSIGIEIGNWGLDLFGNDEPPEFVSEAAPYLQSVLDGANGLGVWIPWALLISVASVIFGIWVIGFIARFVKWVASWIPTMSN